MTNVTQIVTPGFEHIAEQFIAVAASRDGWSGAMAAYVGGEPVLDLWAGPAYDGTQLQAVYSRTKGIGAACCALLIQRGLVDIAHGGLAARPAVQRPFWEPGTRHGYHSLLMGTLMRELVWRVTGRSTREFL